jgi:hypothetical protein
MSRLQAIRFNASCAVCYEDYAEGDTLTSPDKCGHVFHKACLDKWLEQKNECPTCRGAISTTPATPATPTPAITTIPTQPRSTPNIYGGLPLMETIYLYNVLQALVKPIEHYGYVYRVAYPDIIGCLRETFKVSIGQETANTLLNKIQDIPYNQTHKQTIIGVCHILYNALIRYVPEQNFGTNQIIRDSYEQVCKIPAVKTFRLKYKQPTTH